MLGLAEAIFLIDFGIPCLKLDAQDRLFPAGPGIPNHPGTDSRDNSEDCVYYFRVSTTVRTIRYSRFSGQNQ